MPAEIEKNKCLRRYRQQDCAICLDNCPGQAIRLEQDLPALDSNYCQDCGFCRAQCPVAASSGPNWIRSARLACQEAGPVEGAITFPCLATVCVEDVLQRLANFLDENLELFCGDCASCSRGNWAAYAEKSRQQIKDWLRAAGWQERCQIKFAPREKEVNRRALFSWLGLRLLEKVERVLEPAEGRLPRPGWDNLFTVLPENAAQRSAERLVLAAEKCSLCHVCSKACPQQALELKESEKSRSLHWQGSKCRDCRICSHLCSEQALSWQPGTWQERLQPTILCQLPLVKCRICGQLLTETANDTCLACHKKMELLQEMHFTFASAAGNST